MTAANRPDGSGNRFSISPDALTSTDGTGKHYWVAAHLCQRPVSVLTGAKPYEALCRPVLSRFCHRHAFGPMAMAAIRRIRRLFMVSCLYSTLARSYKRTVDQVLLWHPVLIAIFGSAIVLFVPLNVLRIVIGVILVLFGIQWLEKAILRYTGLKARHDEAQIFQMRRQEFDSAGDDRSKFSKLGFLTSFKSVLLEGLEVAVIVITFGSTDGVNRFQGIVTTTLAALLVFLVVGALFCRRYRGKLLVRWDAVHSLYGTECECGYRTSPLPVYRQNLKTTLMRLQGKIERSAEKQGVRFVFTEI